MQESVNLANHGLLEFRLVRGLGAGHESFVKTLKRDYTKLAERPDSQTVMAQLPKWFDDYNSYHPHSALGYVPPELFREKRAVN
jgi:transposase InsO family protein